MQTYLVGGSVRDQLLGLPVHDRDWVVIGARPADLLSLGYTQVGADFPVFLHPETREEHALGRIERKVSAGYLGFETSTENVTLEEDLGRRDLSINALALDPATGKLIDPFHGQADLHARVLRHVGPAFVEDPVRILRVLRLHARFGPTWRIACETRALMHEMVRRGDASTLAAERIWKELSRALLEPHPELFVQGLVEFGLHCLPCFGTYRCAAEADFPGLRRSRCEIATRFCLAFGFAPTEHFRTTSDLPVHVRRAAHAFARVTPLLSESTNHTARAEHWLKVLETMALFNNQTEQFEQVALAVECSNRVPAETSRKLDQCVAALARVDIQSIASSMKPGPAVGQAIRAARLEALTRIRLH